MSFREFAQQSLPKVYRKNKSSTDFKVGDLIKYVYGNEILYAVITRINKRDDQTRIHGRFHESIQKAIKDTNGWIRNGNAKYCTIIEREPR